MGVTIHCEGNLKSQDSFEKVIDIAKQFAQLNDLTCSVFQEDNKLLERVKDEKDWNYQGPTMGLVMQPDKNSDPLNLEFDRDFYIQEYCKTQFANVSVHILIIDLLRQMEPYFENLNVTDEGEYWDTCDISLLQENLDNCFKAIDEAKQEEKSLDGPFRLDNGRIVDLMRNQE